MFGGMCAPPFVPGGHAFLPQLFEELRICHSSASWPDMVLLPDRAIHSAAGEDARRTAAEDGGTYFFRPRIASRASLSAVLLLSVSRLSHNCLPLANANSTFTLPFLKYIRTGISVSPFCCVLPISLRISSLCMSSLRVRSGAWLFMLPCS